MSQCLIAPSLLAADLGNIDSEVQTVTKAGADLLHLDIMDGHYVPNLTFGPDFLATLKKQTNLPIDVHLMVNNPAVVIPWFIKAGASWVSFHPETESHPYKLLQDIQKAGVKAGIALNPGTHWSVAEPLLPVLDFVLLMSVNPGFGGQAFIPTILNKIALLKALKPNLLIEIDGGVNIENAPLLHQHGADILVAGSAIFHAQKPATYASVIKGLRPQ